MRKNFLYVGSAYLFLVEGGKILLQRRFKTGYEDGNYGVPAGHMEGGETVREACVREIKEEVGITIAVDDLEVVHVMHRLGTDDERFDFFLVASKYTGAIENCEPHKCDKLDWFSLEDLPENTIGYIRKAITHYKEGTKYSEFGWNIEVE